MARYTPPEQSKAGAVRRHHLRRRRDLRRAVAAAEAGTRRRGEGDRQDRNSDLGSARPERRPWRRIWEKLGYTPETAHDIIQNRFHYKIDWPTLVIMAAVLIGYFVFLFRASDKEYREVIAEKFGDQKE